MTDYTLEDTVYKRFTTRAFATGIPGTLGGTPVVSAYEDDSITQITAGITLGVDHDGVTGLNLLTIVATAANGFETGKSYDLVITTGTVAGVSVVGEVVWHFTLSAEAASTLIGVAGAGLTNINLPNQTMDITGSVGSVSGAVGSVTAQVSADMTAISGDSVAADNLEAMYDGTGYVDATAPSSRAQVGAIGSSSGGSLSFEANADNSGGTIDPGSTAFVGVETNNFTDIDLEDGVYHIIDDSTNVIDVVYGFSVGGGRTASELIFKGFANANNDDLTISVWDHVGAGWDAIGTLEGQNGSSNVTITEALLSRHTGTGSELGKTYVRFNGSGLTASGALNTDQLLIEAVGIGQTVGYANGRIWVDTNNGVAGTEAFVNGVADNPTNLIASAKTLSSSIGMPDFHIINGSLITLAESSVNESYFGDNWTLALGGQDADEAYFQGAHVSGVALSATEIHFEGCDVGTMSVQIGHFDFCAFSGTVTQTLAGNYEYHNCYSNVAGVGAPTFTKTAGQAITVEWRNWMDSITVSGLQAGDTITINGRLGTVTLNGADATVEIRGSYKSIVNNLTGAPTVNIAGAWKGSDIADTLTDTGELQVDWADGGRLDSILDARMAEASINTTGGAIDTVTTVTNQLTAPTIANQVWDTDATGRQTQGTFGQAIGDPAADADTIYGAVVTGAAGANISVDIVALKAETALIILDTNELQTDDIPTLIANVQSDTDDLQIQIGTAGAGLTDLGGMSTGMKGEVESEANDALVAQKLDHLVAAADGDDPVNGSIMAHLVSVTEDWSTFVPSTDSLQALRDRGDAAWVTGGAGSDRLLLADTTIATLATQVSFTLTAGSTDNDAYNNCTIVVEDVAAATQKAVGMVLAYAGGTKTITLKEALAFTIAATDKVYILAENSLKSTVANRQLDVTANGAAGIDWGNVENPTTVVDLSATDIQLVDTTTVNTDMVGTDGALTDKAGFSLSTAGILAIWHQALTAVVTAGSVGKLLKDEITSVRMATLTDWINGGRLDLLLDAIPTTAMRGTDSAALASVATEARLAELDAGNLPADIAALNNFDPTAQLTESYAANGVAPTSAQMWFAIHQMLMQFGIGGTSITVRKLDDIATAFVVTLDDGTDPTDAKRV